MLEDHLLSVDLRSSATVRELMLKCGTNWPHKRIDEMTDSDGYVFVRDDGLWCVTGEKIMRESRRYRGRDIRVYRMVRA